MFYLHLSKKMNVITRSCMNPPQHQMTPFANPKMHRGSASKSYFYNWYTVCYVHKRGEADLQELPSYFMDCTPHRIIKCTFKQHNRPCGWVVMLAWNWNSALWSKISGAQKYLVDYSPRSFGLAIKMLLRSKEVDFWNFDLNFFGESLKKANCKKLQKRKRQTYKWFKGFSSAGLVRPSSHHFGNNANAPSSSDFFFTI